MTTPEPPYTVVRSSADLSADDERIEWPVLLLRDVHGDSLRMRTDVHAAGRPRDGVSKDLWDAHCYDVRFRAPVAPPEVSAGTSLEERSRNFNDTTGALYRGGEHPDKCVCQDEEKGRYRGTPHKHHGEPPFRCARCECEAYRPAVTLSPQPAPSPVSPEAECKCLLPTGYQEEKRCRACGGLIPEFLQCRVPAPSPGDAVALLHALIERSVAATSTAAGGFELRFVSIGDVENVLARFDVRLK